MCWCGRALFFLASEAGNCLPEANPNFGRENTTRYTARSASAECQAGGDFFDQSDSGIWICMEGNNTVVYVVVIYGVSALVATGQERTLPFMK